MLSLVQLCILHVLFSPAKPRAWTKMAYVSRNKEKLLADGKARSRLRQLNSPEVSRKANREYARRNRPALVEYARIRRQADVAFRLEANLRSRTRHAMLGRGAKSARTLELLGCSGQELCVHLQEKFTPEMTWDNYGKVWEVDHKLPCAKFDLSDPQQQRECFHFTNLQPLLVEDNRRKRDHVS